MSDWVLNTPLELRDLFDVVCLRVKQNCNSITMKCLTDILIVLNI